MKNPCLLCAFEDIELASLLDRIIVSGDDHHALGDLSASTLGHSVLFSAGDSRRRSQKPIVESLIEHHRLLCGAGIRLSFR